MKNNSFAMELISWYAKSARDLPWRRTGDPYRIWISEVMLQQTTVKAVVPYYSRWVREFPTVCTVARASSQKILKFWQGLGYYNRARNLHEAAKIIVTEHQSRIPCDPEVLRKLPGFGPYTVGAVLSIAFDKRISIIDANIRRVIMRILSKRGNADVSKDKGITKFLERVMPQRDIRSFNQALMELGALVCRSKDPLCVSCPVNKYCQAYKQGIQEIIPTPKKNIVKKIEVVIAVIKKGKKYFIQKRPARGLLANLWEFPGGKIESGETPKQALIREVKEEIAVDIVECKHFLNVNHFYTQFQANLHVWLCQVQPDPKVDIIHKWVSLSEIRKYPLPSGSAKIVEALQKMKVS